ncbi:MAG: hypothetical protein ACI35S_02295 [Anaeroplasma sp.]
MKRRIFGFLAAFLAAASLCSCDNSNNSDVKTYVAFDINPSIELIVDSKNVVTNVYATNDDAKVLLFNETIEGKDLATAVEKILDLSIEYGYLSEDNKVVEYTITSSLTDKKEEKLDSMIKSSFDAISTKANMEIKLNKNVNFTIERKLEEFKNENLDNETIQNLSAEHYKLILSAMECDNTLTIEVALDLSLDELIEIIRTSRDEFYNIATQKYVEAVAKKKIAYHKVLNSFSRNVYASYYMTHVSEHPVNYGLLYSLYGQVADTLDEVIVLSSSLDNYEPKILNEEEITKIKEYIEELGVELDEKLTCLKDEQGNITIDSVNDYFNKLIKNLETKDDKVINKIKEITNHIEKRIHQQENNYANSYKNDLNNVLNMVNISYNQLKLMAVSLTDECKAILDEYVLELDELIMVIKSALEDTISVEQLKTWSQILREKEEELFNTIQSDLSEDELTNISENISKVDLNVNNAKNELEQIKEKSMEEIEEYLKNKKQSLRK